MGSLWRTMWRCTRSTWCLWHLRHTRACARTSAASAMRTCSPYALPQQPTNAFLYQKPGRNVIGFKATFGRGVLRPVLRTLRLQTRACFDYVGERLLCGAFLGRGQLGGRHGRQPRGSFKPRAGLFTSDTDAVLLAAKPHQAGPAGVVPPAAHPLRSSPRVRRPWRQLWPVPPIGTPGGPELLATGSVLQISAPTAKELAQRAVKQRAALAAIKCKEDYQSRRVHRAAMLPHGHTGEAYNCALVQSLPVDRARRCVHSLWMETCVSVQTSMNMWLQIPCFT